MIIQFTFSVAVARSRNISRFGPPIPENSMFPLSMTFREFLLTKVINGENTAHYAGKFKVRLSDDVCTGHELSITDALKKYLNLDYLVFFWSSGRYFSRTFCAWLSFVQNKLNERNQIPAQFK